MKGFWKGWLDLEKKVARMNKGYPKKEDIKVEWMLIHTAILVFTALVIVGCFIYVSTIENIAWTKYLTVLGLYVDIIGVVIASLKTPYHGTFYDAGQIERNRQEVESRYFRYGMFLIALGMIFQTVSSIFQ